MSRERNWEPASVREKSGSRPSNMSWPPWRPRESTTPCLELSGPEPPILDGSFQEYLEALERSGAEDQGVPRAVIQIREPLTLELDSGEFYVAAPGKGLRISATIEFEHPGIGRQFGTFFFSEGSFAQEIAPARTFGFKADAEALHARGLALGASLENTVVLDENGVMNEELRFPDEFLRHKVGDMVGDLFLLGASLDLHIVAERPSHQWERGPGPSHKEGGEPRGAGAPIVDAEKIMQYLPHRFPMLLVDRIVEVESGKRIVGIKNVTINEPFFQGHFPGHPIMPGVLIIEAMGQVGGLLLMDCGGEARGLRGVLHGPGQCEVAAPGGSGGPVGVRVGNAPVQKARVQDERTRDGGRTSRGRSGPHGADRGEMSDSAFGPGNIVETEIHPFAISRSGCGAGPGRDRGPLVHHRAQSEDRGWNPHRSPRPRRA